MLIGYVQYAITGCLPLPAEPMLNRVVHAKLLNKGTYSINHEILAMEESKYCDRKRSHVFSFPLKLTLTSYFFDSPSSF